jgi:hypothetical protein
MCRVSGLRLFEVRLIQKLSTKILKRVYRRENVRHVHEGWTQWTMQEAPPL